MASDVVMLTTSPPSLTPNLPPSSFTNPHHTSPPHQQPADAPTPDAKRVDWRAGKKPTSILALHDTTRLSRIVTADPKWPTHNTALVWKHVVRVRFFREQNPILSEEKWTSDLSFFLSCCFTDFPEWSYGGITRFFAQSCFLSTSAFHVFTSGVCLPSVVTSWLYHSLYVLPRYETKEKKKLTNPAPTHPLSRLWNCVSGSVVRQRVDKNTNKGSL